MSLQYEITEHISEYREFTLQITLLVWRCLPQTFNSMTHILQWDTLQIWELTEQKNYEIISQTLIIENMSLLSTDSLTIKVRIYSVKINIWALCQLNLKSLSLRLSSQHQLNLHVDDVSLFLASTTNCINIYRTLNAKKNQKKRNNQWELITSALSLL